MILLTLGFFYGCEKNIDTSQDTQLDTRARGGNGNGNGNGGGEDNPPPLYEIVYDGSIFKSNVAYYRFQRSNGKYNIMSPDCGDLTMTDGFEAVGCYIGEGSICGDWREIRQFDKKANPEKVAAHFAFVDPINGSNVRFTMLGVIKDLTDGEYTIFPTNEGSDVELILDRWKTSGLNASCDQETTIDFSTPQHITIKLVNPDDWDCSTTNSPTCN